MPSALSRSYSLPLSQNLQSGVKVSTVDTFKTDADIPLMTGSSYIGSQKTRPGFIDPKAVGSHLAHRSLSRRGSIVSSDATLSSNDSLSMLSGHLNQHSFVQYAVSASFDEVKRPHRKLERTQSEPNRPAAANSSRYKTELCRPFEENGSCKYGDKCQFAHGFHELRSLPRHPKYKTELCKTFHTVGFCPYGPRCHFIHNAEEARTNSPASSNMNNSSQRNDRFKKTVPVSLFALGSTAESPSPPSSLSESPTSGSSFFSDDLFPGNPFSPAASSGKNAFFYDSDFGSPFFARSSSRYAEMNQFSDLYSEVLNAEDLAGLPVKLPGFESPSPAESLASDLDSLSLGSDSPPPPTISSPMETSRGLRLPIFSRISENSTESEDSN